MNLKLALAPAFVCVACLFSIAGPSLAQSVAVKPLPPSAQAATHPVARAGAQPNSTPGQANSTPGQPAAQPGNQPIEEPQATSRGEPDVKHIVIEDDGSKIEELRVRGQTQQVVVTPKVGTTKSYEIIVGRGGHEANNGTGGAQSAVGKRVW